jgi:hypothetical protein
MSAVSFAEIIPPLLQNSALLSGVLLGLRLRHSSDPLAWWHRRKGAYLSSRYFSLYSSFRIY